MSGAVTFELGVWRSSPSEGPGWCVAKLPLGKIDPQNWQCHYHKTVRTYSLQVCVRVTSERYCLYLSLLLLESGVLKSATLEELLLMPKVFVGVVTVVVVFVAVVVGAAEICGPI